MPSNKTVNRWNDKKANTKLNYLFRCWHNSDPIIFIFLMKIIPLLESATTATFADDTGILAVGKNKIDAKEKRQQVLNEVNEWTKRWRIKLNETKSTHIDFVNRRPNKSSIIVNNNLIPYDNIAKLSMHLNVRLRWKGY